MRRSLAGCDQVGLVPDQWGGVQEAPVWQVRCRGLAYHARMSICRRLLLQLAATTGLMGLQGRARASTVVDGQWLDAGRQRKLPWRLRVPAVSGPWPVVLFSHGLGGSREGGAAWSEAWSAAGMAVLHLQHPGSDTSTLLGGMATLRRAATAEQLRERVLDVRFVLDELTRQAAAAGPGASVWSSLRLDAVGLAGPSFGAHTTQALAGQRYGVPADFADQRLKAFVALSPSAPRGPGANLQRAFGDIRRPFMAITGSLDGDPLGGDNTAESRAQVFDGLPQGQRALLWLAGADHMSFAGGSVGPIPSAGPFQRHGDAARLQTQHHGLVAQITSWWWRAHLAQDPQALAALRQPQALASGDRFVLD